MPIHSPYSSESADLFSWVAITQSPGVRIARVGLLSARILRELLKPGEIFPRPVSADG